MAKRPRLSDEEEVRQMHDEALKASQQSVPSDPKYRTCQKCNYRGGSNPVSHAVKYVAPGAHLSFNGVHIVADRECMVSTCPVCGYQIWHPCADWEQAILGISGPQSDSQALPGSVPGLSKPEPQNGA